MTQTSTGKQMRELLEGIEFSLKVGADYRKAMEDVYERLRRIYVESDYTDHKERDASLASKIKEILEYAETHGSTDIYQLEAEIERRIRVLVGELQK